MRRHGASLLLALVLPASASAAEWQRLGGRQPVPAGARVAVEAVGATPFALDHAALRDRLAKGIRPVIRIPAPDGTLERFRATESPVLSPALQRRHPSLRSFSAVGLDDPAATARFDVGPLGFHASVRSADGFRYVDPRFVGKRDQYLAYARANLVDRHGAFSEETVEGLGEVVAGRAAQPPGEAVVRRTYRLALASDPTYGDYFGAANVAAAKLALVNRVNQIYNDDLAVALQLVADVRYDPVATVCTSAMLDENQVAMDEIVGAANYDIGHIVLGTTGGGIAQRPALGTPGKARGCTGVPRPEGDAFFVDYVAHEMGHQFGASHTFNGIAQSCGTERSNLNAVEPGSGSSIMGYAGICDGDDLQGSSDPYLSQRSIAQIQFHVDAVPSVGAAVTTANRSPQVFAPAEVTIPVRTPFRLEGTATDEDNEALVFTWEQNDPGTGTALRDNAKPNGPLFRATLPMLSGLREFPGRAQLAADDTSAESASCANLDCFAEFLPTSPRSLHFRLTARDRSPLGGGVSAADAIVRVAGSEPFAVTGPATSQLTGAATTTVTWDVAGTDGPPFDVPSVRISFSGDGGLTFPTVVAASTPNDGSEEVAVPDPAAPGGRFMVEAIGNVFFDVTDAVPNPDPTPTPTPSASPSPTPTPSPTETPTATSDYVIPTATATPTSAPSVFPGTGKLGPDLSLVRRRLAADRKGRIKLSLRCKQLTAGTRPATCNGRARLTYAGGRKAAAKRFSFGSSQVGLVTLRLNPKARRAARRRALRGRLTAKVGRRTARKAVKLRRIR